MKKTISILSLALSTALIAAPLLSYADDAKEGTETGMHGQVMPIDKKTESLKEKLNITSTQDPAWKAYVSSIKQDVEDMKAARKDLQTSKTLPAPERMSKHIDLMEKHLADLKDTQGKLNTLYGQLSADQKKIFDSFGHHWTKGKMKEDKDAK